MIKFDSMPSTIGVRAFIPAFSAASPYVTLNPLSAGALVGLVILLWFVL